MGLKWFVVVCSGLSSTFFATIEVEIIEITKETFEENEWEPTNGARCVCSSPMTIQ